MEHGVYQHLAKLDAALIIIDCNWNMDGPTIAAGKSSLLSPLVVLMHTHCTVPKMIIFPR